MLNKTQSSFMLQRNKLFLQGTYVKLIYHKVQPSTADFCWKK